MTDEQINVAIAEACGFVCLHEFQVNQSGPKFAFWDYPPTWTGPKKQPWLLDFCNDLNAMHEALKTLPPDQLWDVAYSLPMETMLGFMATARELAETFLMVIGKWEATTEDSSAVQKEVQG